MDHLSSALTGNKERKQAAAQKKLKKFLEKGSLKDRFKALISYLDKATDDELKKFFNEHFYMIYGVFLDTFSAYENQCKRGRQEASLLKDLLLVLKNVMIYLSDYVKKGWQIRSIGMFYFSLIFSFSVLPITNFSISQILVYLLMIILISFSFSVRLGKDPFY